MKEGMTYKEKYIALVNSMKDVIRSREDSVVLANKVLNDNNLTDSNIDVRASLLKAINDNEVVINELNKLLYCND